MGFAVIQTALINVVVLIVVVGLVLIIVLVAKSAVLIILAIVQVIIVLARFAGLMVAVEPVPLVVLPSLIMFVFITLLAIAPLIIVLVKIVVMMAAVARVAPVMGWVMSAVMEIVVFVCLEQTAPVPVNVIIVMPVETYVTNAKKPNIVVVRPVIRVATRHQHRVRSNDGKF